MQNSESNSYIVPGLVGIALSVIAAVFIGKSNLVEIKPAAITPVAASTEQASHEPSETPSTGAATTVELESPDGNVLLVPVDSMEAKVIEFIKSGKDPEVYNVWFDLVGNNFADDAGTLTEDARAQLVNVATIMKAFPEIDIDLLGHWSADLDVAAARRQTSAVAKAGKDVLTASGIDGKRVSAVGLGSTQLLNVDDSKNPNNRRLSIRVMRKQTPIQPGDAGAH